MKNLKKTGKNLKIIQRAKDGTVEAIEHTTLPIYGVQYHPEGMGASGQKILKQFVKICEYNRKYKISEVIIKENNDSQKSPDMVEYRALEAM